MPQPAQYQKSNGSTNGGLGQDIVRNKMTNFKINQGPGVMSKDSPVGNLLNGAAPTSDQQLA